MFVGGAGLSPLARLTPPVYVEAAMRTYLARTGWFTALLVVCLMFAPARRRVTGDPQLAGGPAIPVDATDRPFADLCRDEPVAAMARSLAEYREKVEGYSCTLRKQERIGGGLKPVEVIACDFRESPFAVRMRWIEGKGRAEAMLYVAGENDDQLLVVPASETLRSALRLVGRSYAKRALDGDEAKAAARYPANEFGIFHSTARVYGNWKAARERGILRFDYDGVQPIPELNGRPCHVLRRQCVVPEEDGMTHVTLLFDAETLLQIGAVLMAGNDLIASYHFQDLRLNPRFDARHFSADRFK